jgi:amino acid permease
MIFSHVNISYFLRVFKYDFSQWPKTLFNTYVYIIICFSDIYTVDVNGDIDFAVSSFTCLITVLYLLCSILFLRM